MHFSANRVHTKDREAEAKENNSAIGTTSPPKSPLDSRLKISRNILRPTAHASTSMEGMPRSATREPVPSCGVATRLLGLRCVPAIADFHESFQLHLCPSRRLPPLQRSTAQAADSRHRLEHRSSGAERGENRRTRPESRPRSPRETPEKVHDPRSVRRRLQRSGGHDDQAAGADEDGIPDAHRIHPVSALRHHVIPQSCWAHRTWSTRSSTS